MQFIIKYSVMKSQIERIKKSNLDQIDQKLTENNNKVCMLEQNLEKRAEDLAKFQQFFANELRQIHKKQSRKIKHNDLHASIKNQLAHFREQFSASTLLPLLKQFHDCHIDTISKITEKYSQIIKEKDQVISDLLKYKQEHPDIVTNNSLSNIHYTKTQSLRNSIIAEKPANRRRPEQPLTSRQTSISKHAQKPRLELGNYASMIGHSAKKSTVQEQASKKCINQSAIKSSIMMEIDNIERYKTDQKTVKQPDQPRNSMTRKQNGPTLPKPLRKCSIDSCRKPQEVTIPQIPYILIPMYLRAPIDNGFGVLYCAGEQVYRGMWKNGQFEGRGKLRGENWIYEGDFKRGEIEGSGTLLFEHYKFMGRFTNNHAEGEGSLYYNDRIISGVWKKNKLIKTI